MKGVFSRSLLFVVCFIPLIVLGNWASNGNAICTATDSQEYPRITSDGSGGAIITWRDYRNGNYDIYTQRIDANGNVLWTSDGVTICNATNTQESPQITPDGSGGAIITWHDLRSGNYDIYAQRIDANGNILWTSNGVTICNAAYTQYSPQIISDGSGGAIIVWHHDSGPSYDIYAQRVDANGNVLWDTNGVAICNAFGNQYSPQITSDGSGGAIIVWQDYLSGNADIYAQRVDANGNVLWATNGVTICNVTYLKFSPQITSDGSGGAIITWYDSRNGSFDIYAQRVDANGNVLWTSNGDTICNATNDQQYPQIISDGSGGAIITWDDYRNGNWDIYTQRVDANGNVLWTSNGDTICNATYDQQYPQIISDGSGGAIIVWQDYRSGNYDIYAQSVDANGNVLWTSNGVTICNATNTQEYPQITSDGSGGAIITWDDYRNGNWDIYAQIVDANGQVGIDEKDKRTIIPSIFSKYIVIKGFEKEKVKLYNITGSLCGEYYGNRIGYDLRAGVYFIRIKGELYKIVKIR